MRGAHVLPACSKRLNDSSLLSHVHETCMEHAFALTSESARAGSDKGSNRHSVTRRAFAPFVDDFFGVFPHGRVYVATEDEGYAQSVQATWMQRWAGRVFVPNITTRVRGETKKGNFKVHDAQQVAHDVLLDIQMLAKTDYFVHGASAVAEAVMYTNPALHLRSTHLEYLHRCTTPQPLTNVSTNRAAGTGAALSCPDAPWRWGYSLRRESRD